MTDDLIEVPLLDFVGQLAHRLSSGDRPVVFFLGAGASVSSGIPTANHLVWKEWLPKLRQWRQEDNNGQTLKQWAKNALPREKRGQDPLSYGSVMHTVFPTAEERQAAIEEIIDRGKPGFGYGILARILTDECYGRSLNTVLTTNFDDLVADALMIFSQRKARIISHESLAAFIRSSSSKPQIIKLHGDARLEPRNTLTETRRLEKSLVKRVQSLLPEAMLVFLGYGGGDASIRELISGIEAAPNGGVWWVNKDLPPTAFRKALAKQESYWVRHTDFDEVMLLLADRLDDLNLTLTDQFKEIRTRFRDHPGDLLARFEKTEGESSELRALRTAAKHLPRKFGEAWRTLQEAERLKHDAPDRADRLYLMAIEQAPTDVAIYGSYADFLAHVKQEPDRAEVMYERAIKADPLHPVALGNYALFLNDIRKENDRAQEMYERAIDADPKHANTLGNYARFLKNIRKDHDRAQEMFERAIDADPKHANTLRNYALFLEDIRKDYDRAQEMYERAIDADPKDANTLVIYALFLKNICDDDDRTQEMFERAIDAVPKHANTLRNYALFLEDIRKDYDRTQEMYERAIDADPKDANTLVIYALFLEDIRKDYDRAQEMYERAIDADPKNANTLGNYAVYLKNIRKDHDGAQEMYERAIDADPKHTPTLGNYALFLKNIRNDHHRAQEMFERAIDADPKHANTLGNYAAFLRDIRKDHDRAQEMFERAIDADPKDANTLGNYGGFLLAREGLGEGMTLVQRAEQEQDHAPFPALDAELAFYRLANGLEDERPAALERLKSRLLEGARSPDFSLTANIERARTDGHPDVEMLTALAKVLTEDAPLETLEAFPAWRDSPPFPN